MRAWRGQADIRRRSRLGRYTDVGAAPYDRRGSRSATESPLVGRLATAPRHGAPRGRSAAPRSPLADSYRSQQYYFRDEGNRYLLTPELPGMESSPSAEPPFELPVHLLSNWHKDGVASTLMDCLAAQDKLCAGCAN